MVFLALTASGLEDALRLGTGPERSIWCGSNAISAEEYQARKVPGLTRFIYSPGASERESIARALDTIEQHHPDETVWVEGAP
jgi:hypothetical protein